MEMQPDKAGNGTLVEVVKDKVYRRMGAHGEKLMLVEVLFEAGAEGARHSHPHEQISYCLSGEFDYSIEDRVIRLKPGDSVAVPGAVVHGTRCVAKGVLIDVFTPPRSDFLA